MLQHPDDQRTLPAPANDRKPITVAEVDAARKAWERRQLAALAPAGQLVLDGHPAQLSLDGAAHSPVSCEASSPEGASPSLGPLHGVLHETPCDLDQDRPDVPLRGQLKLPLSALDKQIQLDLWARLERSHSLLSDTHTHMNDEGHRAGGYIRQAKCQRTRIIPPEDNVSATRWDSGAYALGGLVSCGSWTCPRCGPQRSRATSSALALVIAAHLEADPMNDCWMLSPTIPHKLSDNLGQLVDRLYRANARFWRSAEWRAFTREHGIVARVRVFDCTHGGDNGSHPHFHVLLLVTRAPIVPIEGSMVPEELVGKLEQKRFARSSKFEKVDEDFVTAMAAFLSTPQPKITADNFGKFFTPLSSAAQPQREKELDHLLAESSLSEAWARCCRSEGVDGVSSQYGLKLSPSEDASSYFLKWGLADEIGASTAKARNHLRLLDAVAAGYDVAGDIYLQFVEAMYGKAWVTGLADACKLYDVTDEKCSDYLTELRERRERELAALGTPVVKVPELRLVIKPYVFPAALRLGWSTVFRFCDEVSERGGDVQAELDSFLFARLVRNGLDPPGG